MYAALERGVMEKEATYMETTYMELACSFNEHHRRPSFDHKITTTLPIPLTEMSNYMASCHSGNDKALYSQFEVLVPFTSFHIAYSIVDDMSCDRNFMKERTGLPLLALARRTSLATASRISPHVIINSTLHSNDNTITS